MNYLVFNFGGGRKAALDQALQTVYAADFAFNRSIQDVLLAVETAYYGAVSAQAGVAAADLANLELSRVTLERNRPLLDKKLISQEDFDTLKTRVAGMEAQLHGDEASLEQARLSLSRCTITAPWAGVCSKRYVDDGNLVVAAQTRLTNIRSYDPIYIDSPLYRIRTFPWSGWRGGPDWPGQAGAGTRSCELEAASWAGQDMTRRPGGASGRST